MYLKTVALALATTLSLQAYALGTNCQGSLNCNGQDSNTIQKLQFLINTQADNKHWNQGEQISCVGHVCAFPQNNYYGITGAQAKAAIADLYQHGCRVCGSDAYVNGDVNGGELTCNWVTNPCTGGQTGNCS